MEATGGVDVGRCGVLREEIVTPLSPSTFIVSGAGTRYRASLNGFHASS
jgi:hypothetical protein